MITPHACGVQIISAHADCHTAFIAATRFVSLDDAKFHEGKYIAACSNSI